MSDKKPTNPIRIEDKNNPRNRFVPAANQDALDEQDDHHLLDNIDANPRPGGRPAETISNSAAAMLQTPNETPGMIVGPGGELYPKSHWRFLKDEYRNKMLEKPLPAIPIRIREPSPVESSTPEKRESWSDEDPAFLGYPELEEEE